MANYLRYANQGATRNQPLDPKLVEALGFLGPMGITAEVFSGGQPSEGPNRVGSHRHDHGGAGDFHFYQGDRKLDWANEADRPIFEDIVRKGKAAGITGMGAGPGYMSPGSMHLGYGTPAVWGAGGSGENAAPFLRSAYGMTINSKPDPVGEVLAAGNAPMLPDPTTVATRPAVGTPLGVEGTVMASAGAEPTLGDKMGSAIFGDEMAAKLKATFGEDAKPNPLSKGLAMAGGAMGGGGGDAQAREHATPIQSSLGAEAGLDASRMQMAQTMMAQMLANRKRPRGLTLGG